MVRREALEALLLGREARACEQKRLLRSSEVVVQVALNVPGLPKSVAGEATLLAAVASCLEDRTAVASQRLYLKNAAGAALLLAFCGPEPSRLKGEAILIEEDLPWGRILDIDVLFEGGSLSRQALGGVPRACLLCDLPAKVCARQANHSLAELRRAFFHLMGEALP